MNGFVDQLAVAISQVTFLETEDAKPVPYAEQAPALQGWYRRIVRVALAEARAATPAMLEAIVEQMPCPADTIAHGLRAWQAAIDLALQEPMAIAFEAKDKDGTEP